MKKEDEILNRLDSIENVLCRINEQVFGDYKARMDTNFDVLIDYAKDIAQEEGRVSPALLQRKLRIGYNRAANLMDQLEKEGLIGPADGAKPRDVLVKIIGKSS